ncbi:MAG: inositol monophosphatase family protein [Baekduia sp.]
MSTDPDGRALLDVAVAAAEAAAAVLLPRFGSETALATKSTRTDVVSAADLEAEAAIRAVLSERAPDDAVLGEEGDDRSGTSGRRWVVDPLDGTVNYLYGIPMWAVSVACEGVAGIVLDPVRGEAFTAIAGEGAWLNGAPLTPSDVTDLGMALTATGFGYDSGRRELQAAVAARALPRVRDLRRAGAAALDLAWCAAGRLDAYWERGVNPWDVAAGELICREAGRTVVRLDEAPPLPWGVLAAAPGVAGELLSLVG